MEPTQEPNFSSVNYGDIFKQVMSSNIVTKEGEETTVFDRMLNGIKQTVASGKPIQDGLLENLLDISKDLGVNTDEIPEVVDMFRKLYQGIDGGEKFDDKSKEEIIKEFDEVLPPTQESLDKITSEVMKMVSGGGLPQK